MAQVNTIFIFYNKERNEIQISNQGYDTSVFNAKDFFKAVDLVKED